jgi:hypothetical protein
MTAESDVSGTAADDAAGHREAIMAFMRTTSVVEEIGRDDDNDGGSGGGARPELEPVGPSAEGVPRLNTPPRAAVVAVRTAEAAVQTDELEPPASPAARVATPPLQPPPPAAELADAPSFSFRFQRRASAAQPAPAPASGDEATAALLEPTATHEEGLPQAAVAAHAEAVPPEPSVDVGVEPHAPPVEPRMSGAPRLAAPPCRHRLSPSVSRCTVAPGAVSG